MKANIILLVGLFFFSTASVAAQEVKVHVLHVRTAPTPGDMGTKTVVCIDVAPNVMVCTKN